MANIDRIKRWYAVFYTHHHGRWPNTAHKMYVKAYNKKEAIEECKRNDKSRFYTFNCMALLDNYDRSEDRYEEKYIAWARKYGVYEEER